MVIFFFLILFWFLWLGKVICSESQHSLVFFCVTCCKKKKNVEIHADAFLAGCQVFPPDTTQTTQFLGFLRFNPFIEDVNSFVGFMAFLYFR